MQRCINEDGVTLLASACEEVETRKLSRAKKLSCPYCKDPVEYCRGDIKKAYFRHPKSDCKADDYENEETENHKKGKEILYKWLKNKYNSAIVKMEKYIKDTKQIADIIVIHKDGEYEGQKWAFEFQHSNLSQRKWIERHNLYQEANIKDFWILDAEIFLLYYISEGDKFKNARNNKALQKVIFSTTGFCYLLNISNRELTIDYNFINKKLSPPNQKSGYYSPNDYTFHSPLKHSSKLEVIEFKYDKEFELLAMYYDGIGREFDEKFESKIRTLQEEKQRIWRENLVNKANQKIQFANLKCSESITSCLSGFIKINIRTIQDDIFNISDDMFLEKYKKYAQRLQEYGVEMSGWENSDDTAEQILYRLSNNTDDKNEIRSLEFLDKNKSSIKEHCYKKYADKIEIVNYVIQEYGNTLEKLSVRDPIKINKWLTKLHRKAFLLTPPKPNPTMFDYAFEYRNIGSKENADEILKVIREEANLLM
ncbi:competence protein CoiA [Bacillus cereus]|uniref:competence protein CoiA n=1 Tax=Bacillus cereus TaxID=1396 RepID=UPI000B4C2092|nr:competence protein CoiA family protein [Bacillus cereus]